MQPLIPSFQVDHTNLCPGIYVSRVDKCGDDWYITTFDIRMTYVNYKLAIDPASMHTIEHVIATYLRNDPKWKDSIIYWGPMGCLTGCYLIMKSKDTPLKPQDIRLLIIDAFMYLSKYEDAVPGATPRNCGNYTMHNLPMARRLALEYTSLLLDDKRFCCEYPKTDRVLDKNGKIVYDA